MIFLAILLVNFRSDRLRFCVPNKLMQFVFTLKTRLSNEVNLELYMMATRVYPVIQSYDYLYMIIMTWVCLPAL